jgi:outer membrane protein assembly factor BamB
MKNTYVITILFIVLAGCSTSITPPKIEKTMFPLPSIAWKNTIEGEIHYDDEYQSYMNHENDKLVFVSDAQKSSSAKKEIVCMKLSTGEVLWRSPLKPKKFTDITYCKKSTLLLFRSDNSLSAVDVKTGKYVWTKDLKFYTLNQFDQIGDSSSICIVTIQKVSEGKVKDRDLYFSTDAARKCNACRIDLLSGDILWKAELTVKEQCIHISDSLIITKDFSTNIITSIDKFTGVRKWQTGAVPGPIIYGVDNLVFVPTEENESQKICVYAMNSGSRVWTSSNIPTMAMFGKLRSQGFFITPVTGDSSDYLLSDFENIVYLNVRENVLHQVNTNIENATKLLSPSFMAITRKETPVFTNLGVKGDTIYGAMYHHYDKLKYFILRFDKKQYSISIVKVIDTNIEKDSSSISPSFPGRDGNSLQLIGSGDSLFVFDNLGMNLTKLNFKKEKQYLSPFIDYSNRIVFYAYLFNEGETAFTVRGYSLDRQQVICELPVASICGSANFLNYPVPIEMLKVQLYTYKPFRDQCQINLFRESYDCRMGEYIFHSTIKDEKLISFYTDNSGGNNTTVVIAYDINSLMK